MYIPFIIVLLGLLIICIIFKRAIFLKNIKRRNKKIIGFQVNGVGNGHIRQAKTVYDILIKSYEIPVVLIYGENKSFNPLFNKSKVLYIKTLTNSESMNNMNIFHALIDIFKKKDTKTYEKKYFINTWVNFFVTDLFNFRTVQINIANQFIQNDLRIYFCIIICYMFSYTKIVSIHDKSILSPHKIVTLVNLKKLDRSKIDPKLVLCYSVSGTNFPNQLNLIAKKYPDYKFKYFTTSKLKVKLPNNVELFKPDKVQFNNYIKSCVLVLCTSGNELIQECVYNYIPVASMPCSKKQFEQMFNYKKYLSSNYISSMYQINFDQVINKKDLSVNDKFNLEVIDRDKKIYSILSELINNPSH